jgi:ElaA protein
VILRQAVFAELDAATLYAVLQLRSEVFVVEQNCVYRDLDGRDLEPDTLHLWLADGPTPVAYLRVLRDPDGTARIGRVVTDALHRGAGHAARLMDAAVATLAPGTVAVLEAQVYARRLYERSGFVVDGETYLEDGIEHVHMRRDPVGAGTSLTAGS